MAKQELLVTLRERYWSSSKKDKSRILDEFIAVTGHHRKHGIRLLGQFEDDEDEPRLARGRRIYDEAVREAVIVIAVCFLVRARHSPLVVPPEGTFSNPGAEAMLLHRADARHLEGQPYCPHQPTGGRSSAEPRSHHRRDAPAAPPG